MLFTYTERYANQHLCAICQERIDALAVRAGEVQDPIGEHATIPRSQLSAISPAA